MATTTPNFGWDVPTSTDYVKDGATAIETLGDDIDATLWTALGGAYPGLRLVKKQTIGSAVTSVTVTGAFSATYENYKIVVSGGVCSTADQELRIQLGASASMKNVFAYSSFAGGAFSQIGTTSSTTRYSGCASTAQLSLNMDLINPFLAKPTTYFSSGYWDSTLAGFTNGVESTSTSFTSFILSVGGSSTLTGGTIYVYGYGIS
jgi:hypothetical protein